MTRSTQLIVKSVLMAMVIVLVWFKAPLVPCLIGAVMASLLMFRTNRELPVGGTQPVHTRR